ncbi:MAG: CoA-binding protein [Clostridiales bacterium]|nr:CoA-binding protein [Clostridiales bacterium]
MSKKTMITKKVWAVVGANQNPDKFGNKIYKKLKSIGYEVYPVNPMYENIDGDTCYKNLTGLPKKPDVINMVVAPEIGKGFIEEAVELKIGSIWFQPGTYSKEIFQFLKDKEIDVVQACILMETH